MALTYWLLEEGKYIPKTDQIELGDEVKDNITGLQGIVVAVTLWLNGCNRIGVQPAGVKDGKIADLLTFDEYQLKIVKKGVHAPAKKTFEPGGPRPDLKRYPDLKR